MQGLVVVRSFSRPHEAHLACSALQAAGIDARLADEYVVTADWLYSNAVGGVKVLVPAGEVEAARTVLDIPAISEPAESADRSAAAACPRCGSHDLAPATRGRRSSFLVWLLLGFPLIPMLRRTRCASCGYTFSARRRV